MKQFFFIFFIFFSFIQSNTVSSANFHSDSNIIRVGFSPGSTAQKIILDAIKEASTSIDIAAYSFTSKLISLALMDAEHRGVKIRVLADKKSNSGKYTAVTYLSNHKIPVRLNNKYSIMHNKFMIIDHKSVQTGSFNYTQSAANKNAENIIFIKNNIDIAEKYETEFNRLWNEALDKHKNYLISN